MSGVTIVRNGVKLGYPFIESIKSILPLCSECIVAVGDSEDGTRRKIEEIGSPKIRIVDTTWDMNNRSGGEVLSQQTNRAMAECSGDWLFYIQADEVAFEQDFDKIMSALARAPMDIDGIAFDYLHFYGSYFTVQPGRNWYRREVRLVRNGRGIVFHGDAQGFRREGKKIRAALSGARMYHYGWARPPDIMVQKIKSFHRLWHDDSWIEKNCASDKIREYFSDLGNLADFNGEHPAVMRGIITHDTEPLIKEWRDEYVKSRTLSQTLKDLSRKAVLLAHDNFIAVKEQR